MTDKEAIIASHHAVFEHVVERDLHWLEDFYPEDYQLRHTGNAYQDKADWLKTLRSGTFRYFDITFLSEDVRLLDDNRAILHWKATTDASIYGYRKVWRMDFETPFYKIDGVWKPNDRPNACYREEKNKP